MSEIPKLKSLEADHQSIKKFDFIFWGGKTLPLFARFQADEKIIAITDENGVNLDGMYSVYDTFFNKNLLELMTKLFESWYVSFSGEAWTTVNAGDIPGWVEFNMKDFNAAIQNGKVILEKDDETGMWFIDELFNLN